MSGDEGLENSPGFAPLLQILLSFLSRKFKYIVVFKCVTEHLGPKIGYFTFLSRWSTPRRVEIGYALDTTGHANEGAM